MKKQIILIDSNAYFRLFLHLTPFLGKIINKRYLFYIIPELENEYKKSCRLQIKFPHFFSKEYIDDRKNICPTSNIDIRKINGYEKFIKSTARNLNLSVSPVDIKYLAYCYNFNCSVVTDDLDMRKLAKEIEVETFSLLEILKKLHDNKFLKIENIREIVGYMIWNNDPSEKNIEKKYKKEFGEELPDYP